MSLFERLKSIRKKDLIIEMNNTGDDDPWDDGGKNNKKKKKPNQNKKFNNKKENPKFESGSFDPANQEKQFVDNEKNKNLNKNKDSLENILKQNTKQNTSDRKLDQAKQTERINRQYDMGGGEVIGTPQDQTYKSPSKNEVKRIMNKSVVNQTEAGKRAKTFRQSFGTPTGADPKTGKPTYAPSYTVDAKGRKKLGPDMELPKGKGNKVPTDKAYEKISKNLGDREAAKKVYLNSRTNKASKEGVKKYIEKARNMASGSNANTKANQKAAENISKISGKTYVDKINQKYGGRRANLKGTSNILKNISQSKNTKKFKDLVGKGFKKTGAGFKKLPFKGKAAVVAGGLAALYYGGGAIKRALTPGQLNRKKDFTPTSAITDTKGKKIRFKYDTYNPATKTTTSAKNLAGPTITKDQLTKFKNKEYNIKDQSGKKIDLEKNIQQSAFTKQLKRANKGTGFFGTGIGGFRNKGDIKFLKKYKKAAEYRGIDVKGIK